MITTVSLTCHLHGDVILPVEHVMLVEIANESGIGVWQARSLCHVGGAAHLIRSKLDPRGVAMLFDAGIWRGSMGEYLRRRAELMPAAQTLAAAWRPGQDVITNEPQPAPSPVQPRPAVETLAFLTDLDDVELVGEVAMREEQDVTALRATVRNAYVTAIGRATLAGDTRRIGELTIALTAFDVLSLGGGA